MNKVMVFGTFDKFHPGHKYFLKKAKAHGERLIVVIARDSTVLGIKGKFPLWNELKRLQKIQELPEVDIAVLGNPDDKYEIIRNHQPDIICLGYDQKHFTENLPKHFPHIIIYRIAAYKPKIYKSSLM